MPESINDLIKKSAEYIRTESLSDRSKDLGDKPYFPMLLLFSRAFSESDINELKDEMRRLWSYSTDKELFYKYSLDNADAERVVFCSEASQYDNCDLSVKCIADAMNSKAADDSFVSGHGDMTQWYIFNIVESESEEAVEKFKANCCIDNVLAKDNNILKTDNLHKVLIVFLHNPPYENNNNVKEKIDYLSNDELYNSGNYETVIIFSDLKNDNTIIKRDEIIKLISDLLLTINHNDENFKDRYANHFKPVPERDSYLYLISFVSLEKPVKRIMCEIVSLLLQAAQERADENETETNIIIEIKRYMDQIQSDQANNYNFLNMLPLKSAWDEIIYDRKFHEVSPMLADKSVLDIISEEIIMSDDAEQYVSGLILQIGKMYSLTDLHNNSEELKKVLNQVKISCLNEPSDSLLMPEFFSGKVNQKLKEKTVNLLIEKIDNNVISKNSKKTIDSVKNLIAEIQKEYIKTDNDLEKYTRITQEFIDNNPEAIKKISAIGNGESEVLGCLLDCIKKIIEENDLFRWSFIEEYEARSKKTDKTDSVYEDIKDKIKNKKIVKRDAEGYELNNVCFTIAGSCIQQPSLEIFFLKTNDQRGKKTNLYNFFNNDSTHSGSKIHYLNTKSEDGIRVLTFYKVSPSDLKNS